MKKLSIKAMLSGTVALLGCRNQNANYDGWSLASGEENGFPLIVRFRNGIPSGVKPVDYPCLVTISWVYKSRQNGLPVAEDNQQMEEFENLLDGSLESGKQGFMMMAITCNGRREWKWYARDSDKFTRSVHSTITGKDAVPIEFSSRQDAEWTAYQKILQRANA